MELPTYTNIWKIEKRLYKLYDFRLPMPLPVGQVASFLVIAVPYAIVLAMAGAPFSHTWLWVYVLPPGALAWLVTRPVLEGKRLHELLYSQLRYLGEPRTWCRMAPLGEPDEISVVARIWRTCPSAAAQQPGRGAVVEHADGDAVAAGERIRDAEPVTARAPAAEPAKPEGRPAPWPAPDMPTRASLLPEDGRRASARWLSVLAAQTELAQRDRARARQPIGRPARIVVLGCTAGAGQTVTTLLTGQVLATLRGEPIAVLDLNPGPASLTEQARAMPRLFMGHHAPGRPGGSDDSGQPRGRGLQVMTAGEDCEQDAASLIDAAAERFPLALADPAARSVPASLLAADQLVLVAPASAAAAGSLAMTLEWLDVNDHERLASAAVIVLTGVSPPSAQHVDKAAAVASGRCRAIVRVPWDERLAALAGRSNTASPAAGRAGPAAGRAVTGPQRLGADAVRAYTALGGVLVSALADADATVRSPQ